MDEKLSEYAVRFDTHNVNWVKDATQRRFFLAAQESYANDRFRAFGHLFLNEVYRMLGTKDTRSGQEVGWVKNFPCGDEEVRFNVIEKPNDEVWVDFNVHGYILDLFDKR